MANRRNLLKRIGATGAAIGLAGATGNALAKSSQSERSLALILIDKSSSMMNVRKSVVNGLNKLISDQRAIANLEISILQFDSTGNGLNIEPTFGFMSSATAPLLRERDYQPRGTTPLLAAVAEAVRRLDAEAAKKKLLVVQTDGYENASPPEITKAVIKDLIQSKEAEGNWTFAFMGADIDAWGEAGSMGVGAANTMSYQGTAQSTYAAYATTSDSTYSWATSAALRTADFYQPGDISATVFNYGNVTSLAALPDKDKPKKKRSQS